MGAVVARLFAVFLAVFACRPAAAAGDANDCARPFDPDKKIAACTRLLAQAGGRPQARAQLFHNRGAGYHIKGAHEAALADYDRALALAPGRAATYNNRADVYMRLCRRGKALGDYDMAVKLGGAERIKSYQWFLKEQKFYSGPPDGRYKPETRKALAAYIRAFDC